LSEENVFGPKKGSKNVDNINRSPSIKSLKRLSRLSTKSFRNFLVYRLQSIFSSSLTLKATTHG